MIRQRMQQDQRRPNSNVSERSSTHSNGESKPKNVTLAIVSLDNDHEDSIQGKSSEAELEASEDKPETGEDDPDDDRSCSAFFSCLKDRPLWRLFLIMTINGLISLAFSALIIRIEKPAQDTRLAKRAELLTRIERMEFAIREDLANPDYDPEETIELLKAYTEAVVKTKHYPDELRWDLLNAQAFITSVQTTTGHSGFFPGKNWP